MPTKIVKEVWVANDGSEHDSEVKAIRHERRQQLVDVFREDGYDTHTATASALTILDFADDIVRILTTTTPE